MNEELLQVLNKIAEAILELRKTVGVVSMLIEDGHCRSTLECGNCQSKRR